MADLYIGTSGWVYKHWTRGLFYPPKLAPTEQLPYYSHYFRTVEINYSFYKLPPREQFSAWRVQSPDGFLFAAKASRYLTHMKKLNEPQEPLQRMMDAMGGLGEKLGPILFQFPKWWRLNLPRLEAFLNALQDYPGHRWAFEFRHQTWLVPEVYALLKQHGAALCLPLGWGIPLDVRLTTDWTYIRFHGGEHSISFPEEALAEWAGRIERFLDGGAGVYAYFNNDPPAPELGGKPAAIHDAKTLCALLPSRGVAA